MPTREERLRHLLLAGTAEVRPFTTVNRGGQPSGPRYPRRSQDEHGRALIEELAAVRQAQEEVRALREEHDLGEVSGTKLSFELDLNPDLPLDSLEDRRAGIQLLAFRATEEGSGVATVLVPEGKLGVFERKLKDYLNPEKVTHKGARRGEALINSINRIRRTVLEDLWTDPVRDFPHTDEPVWWEIWVREQAGIERFREHAERLDITVGRQVLQFPDRAVLLARATVEQMTLSVDLLDSIAELREARSLYVEVSGMDSRQERDTVDDLRRRMEAPADGCPAVCVLDTGVDVGHPLLEPGLPPESAFSYDETNWGVDDHEGHGTQMAGFALFGDDLDQKLLGDGPVLLRHEVESVKILPRQGENPPELYGEITQASVARVETHDPHRLRTFCLSITAAKCLEGRPTSWSAAIDQLGSGAEEEGRPARLVFVSSGNANTALEGYSYPDSNHTDCIEDPAQAWNAITVGAYTEKTTIQEEECRDWSPVAPAGDMSPCNTTALAWESGWPNKPDLVLEGGNMAWDPSSGLPDSLESLALLTTRRRRDGTKLTCWSGDTSGANATGARLGILVRVEYPDLWPETVRALLIHSGRWTAAMGARFPNETPRRRAEHLLRCYGFGVPDLARALYSLRHHLTLVVQETIQPFRLDGNEAKSNEMHLHRIPWPTEVLQSLGETPVRMRVTLSYFIEPKPGQRGTSRRYRYASHGLRFAVKAAWEGEAEFLGRINREEREEGGAVGGSSDSGEWLLGSCRDRGSVHSDVWIGTAADLASKELIAVYPVLGWWRDPRRRDRCERRVQYALVVSIESDADEIEVAGVPVPVDFYTEVLNQIEIEGQIQV
jgi:hypothetical protein